MDMKKEKLDVELFLPVHVMHAAIEMSPMPRGNLHDLGAEEAAKELVRACDKFGYSRNQVHGIAHWFLFLSTQA